MKKLIVFALLACVGFMLRADVMNWMVNTGSPSAGINAARLMTVQGSADTYPEATGGTQLAATPVDANGLGNAKQITLGDLTPATTYFYIELGNYSSETGFKATQVAGTYSYSDLVSAGMISSNGMSMPAENAFGVAGVSVNGKTVSYSQVPEPGTATLILLGMAIAGLKRRRV